MSDKKHVQPQQDVSLGKKTDAAVKKIMTVPKKAIPSRKPKKGKEKGVE